MSTRGCINGTLAAADTYSSPVPIIGLYVAAASVVCMLMMLYDIVHGIRAYKRWLPCKSFALNSVTLALLSIATKLPVDLTTPMPSVQDQLSKLSGTVLICIAMGFFGPSVGIATKSERLANMAALSIFVVTIIVNISIQISTGVIVLFVPEHFITLSCMFNLLMMLWSSSSDVGYHKIVSTDHSKSYWVRSLEPMLKRLKYCQFHTYSTNPQFVASKLPKNLAIGALCLVSLVVQIQAAVRSLILKEVEFCGGNSDYDWSVFPIVIAQTLTVMVGSFAVNFRCLTMANYKDSKLEEIELKNNPVVKSPILRAVSFDARYNKFLLMLTDLRRLVTQKCLAKLAPWTWWGSVKKEKLDQWTKRKAAEDRKRLRDAGRRDFPYHMFQLLRSTTSSSQLQFNGAELQYQGLDVSSLTIVLVVRVAQLVLPDKHSRSLVEAFVEVKELIHFIDKTIHPKNIRYRNMLLLAKVVWAGNDFSCLIPVKLRDGFIKLEDEDRKLLEFADALPSDPVLIELKIILDFIIHMKSLTAKDLRTVLEETFAGMLRVVLAKLPCVINTSLTESPAEYFEKRVRFALQQLFRMRCFDDQIQWSFPDNCTRLISEDSEADSGDFLSAAESGDLDQVTGDVTDNVSTNNDDTATAVNPPTAAGYGGDDVIVLIEDYIPHN